MIELCFIIFVIPKMMRRLAREHKRSAVAWSLIGIGAWLGAEVLVAFGLGMFYGLGAALWGWPERPSPLFLLLAYAAALAAAIGSLTLTRRLLSRRKELPSPPPPPTF
ncbi:MAG: hypothetical protein QOF02_4005 [Blastocatellia bacterium]|jgi:hypothetical protein|nr:hypothetical protein [Blastocatellia bacterium]